jgi:hypothetical protein
MIDHGTARRASATALDFDLDAEERSSLEDHLRTCAACRTFSSGLAADAASMRDLDLGPVPIQVRANIAIVAERRERGRGASRTVLLAAAALLIVAVVGGVAAGVGALPGDRGAAVERLGRPVHWTTEVVDLSAEDLWLEVGGQIVVPPDDSLIALHSDPGDAGYWTLEVAWMPGQVDLRRVPRLRHEMRINLYFSADDEAWRIDEARIYDGQPQGDWLELRGANIAGAPIGAAFTGDIDIVLPDRSGPDTGPGRLVMRGVHLATRAGGALAPQPANPLDPNGGPLPPLPVPAVDCGTVPKDECAALTKLLEADVALAHPGRTIVSIVLSADGGSTVTLDDGSVITTVDATTP